MRFVAAVCAFALLAASPAAAITGGSSLPAQLPLAKDKSRSCQAGKKAAAKAGLLGGKHRFAVVACEQPPKSNLITAGAITKATAAALAALG